jgi:hypothetical protein
VRHVLLVRSLFDKLFGNLTPYLNSARFQILQVKLFRLCVFQICFSQIQIQQSEGFALKDFVIQFEGFLSLGIILFIPFEE